MSCEQVPVLVAADRNGTTFSTFSANRDPSGDHLGRFLDILRKDKVLDQNQQSGR